MRVHKGKRRHTIELDASKFMVGTVTNKQRLTILVIAYSPEATELGC